MECYFDEEMTENSGIAFFSWLSGKVMSPLLCLSMSEFEREKRGSDINKKDKTLYYY